MRLLVLLHVCLIVALTSTATCAQEGSNSIRSRAKSRLQRLASSRQERSKPSSGNKSANSERQDKSRPGKFNNPNDPQFQPKPDLVAIYVIDEGNNALILVQNRGKLRSNATNVRLQVSSLGAGPTTMRFADLPALEPNKTKLLRIRGLSLKYVSMFAQVDFPNLVSESNEGNNSASHVVNEQPQDLADLAITKMEFFPKEKQVWVTVHNYGRKPVARAPLHLVSKFGLKTSPRMRHTVENLKPGIFQTFRFFPKEMLRGTQFEATVDVNNKVPERSENNNRLVRTF